MLEAFKVSIFNKGQQWELKFKITKNVVQWKEEKLHNAGIWRKIEK